jgi:hypothetical protein
MSPQLHAALISHTRELDRGNRAAFFHLFSFSFFLQPSDVERQGQ